MNRGLFPKRQEPTYRGKWKDHPKVIAGEWEYQPNRPRGPILTARGWNFPPTSGTLVRRWPDGGSSVEIVYDNDGYTVPFRPGQPAPSRRSSAPGESPGYHGPVRKDKPPKGSSNQIDDEERGLAPKPERAKEPAKWVEEREKARKEYKGALDRLRKKPTRGRAKKVVDAAAKVQATSDDDTSEGMAEARDTMSAISEKKKKRFQKAPYAAKMAETYKAQAEAQQTGSEVTNDWLKDVKRRKPPGAYTIKKGDTLSGIAKEFYGDAWRWPAIYENNLGAIGRDPKLLEPETPITIP